MKVLSFANTKGGVGKSIICLATALELSERGYKTLIIDYDDQASITRCYQKTPSEVSSRALVTEDVASCEPKQVRDSLYVVPASDNLIEVDNMDFSVFMTFKENVRRLYADFDFVLIDTPGHYGTRVTSALFASDYFAVPVELDGFSLQALYRFQDLIKAVHKFNPDLVLLGIVPNLVKGISRESGEPLPVRRMELDVYRQLQAAFGADLMLPMVGSRETIRGCHLEGHPTWRSGRAEDASARSDIEGLVDAVLKKIGGTDGR